MKKSLVWSAALLGIVLLLSVVSASAASTGLVQAQLGPATSIYSAAFAVPSGAVALPASAVYTWGDDGKDKDKDGDGDNDKDDHHHKHHHEPTPEPSTLLSFGAAILIGGGVLYSRRARKSK